MGNQSVMLWTMGMELTTVYVSESAQIFLGYTAEELLALPTFTTIAEQSQAAIANMFTDYMALEASGKPFMGTGSIRVLRLHKDGSTFWSENYVSFMRDEGGVA